MLCKLLRAGIASAIVNYAKQHEADLVVLGSRGMGNATRWEAETFKSFKQFQLCNRKRLACKLLRLPIAAVQFCCNGASCSPHMARKPAPSFLSKRA